MKDMPIIIMMLVIALAINFAGFNVSSAIDENTKAIENVTEIEMCKWIHELDETGTPVIEEELGGKITCDIKHF